MKNYDLTAKESNTTLKLNNMSADIHLELGRMYRERGDYEPSIKEFEQVSKIKPYSDAPFFKNKILNEIEISQKKTVLNSKPRELGVTLTSRCNLRCIMCGVWKKPWDVPEKTVREIIELFPYLQHIFWQGGEVFLSDFFEELLEEAASYPNLKQDIITNGLFINEEWTKRLVKANITLIYSIDGVTKDTYENIRRGARFEDLLKSISIISECKEKYYGRNKPSNRMCTGMQVVVMRSNYHQLGEFIDFAKKYKFDFLQLTPIETEPGEENIFLHKDLKAAEHIEKVKPEIFKKGRNYGIKLEYWLHDIKGSHSEKLETHQEPKTVTNLNKMLCYLPWQYLFVGIEGKAIPHCFCRKVIGNVHSNSLMEIWNGRVMQTYRQKILNNDYEDWCDDRCISGIIPESSLKLS